MGYSNYPDGMRESDIPGWNDIDCPDCEGSGIADCEECDHGLVTDENGDKHDCPECESTGTTDCGTCDGQGMVDSRSIGSREYD
jgi:DnaJ-class molecular chaperone